MQPSQNPFMKKTPNVRLADSKAAAPDSKPKKRENTFSKSRDTREDRGTREMKTSHNSQTMPHGR